jgi:tRNA G18 (ribose-2'-O)-methylase SpoU
MPGPAIRKKTALRQQKRAHENLFENAPELVFLLQDWTDAYNVGGLFRVAAACGASKLVMVGKTPVPPNPMIGVTSLGMHRRVDFEHFDKWQEAVESLRAKGFSLVGVEITEDATPYVEFEYPPKVALVLGSEGAGVSPKLLAACDASVFIPMVGKGRSLNVHVAGAIIAFDAVLRQKK